MSKIIFNVYFFIILILIQTGAEATVPSSFLTQRHSFPKYPNHGLGFYAKTVVISANQTDALAEQQSGQTQFKTASVLFLLQGILDRLDRTVRTEGHFIEACGTAERAAVVHIPPMIKEIPLAVEFNRGRMIG